MHLNAWKSDREVAFSPWQVVYASLGSGLLRFDFSLLEILLQRGTALQRSLSMQGFR